MTSSPNASKTTIIATLMKGMDTEKLGGLGVSAEDLESIMSQFQKLSLTSSDKAPRVRKEVSPEDRCMARTWGSKKEGDEGKGPQCKGKHCGGDYCKMHAKKAAETESPCCVIQDGGGKWIKQGLFMGRIDRPLTGKDAAGKWQIIWEHPDMKAAMDAEKVAGTFVVGELEVAKRSKKCTSGPRAKKDPSEKKTKGAKKEKAPKAPRGKNAYMCFAASVRAEFKAQIEEAGGLEGATEEDQAKVSAKGTAKVGPIAKLTGDAWAKLSADEKKPFEELAAADKADKLAAFEATQLVENAVGIAVTDQDKVVLKALTAPASPPKAPKAEAEAEALLGQMAAETPSAADEGEVDEEGPWQFDVSVEHPLVGVEDETDGIAAKLSNGTIVVVSREWYDEAPEEISDSLYEEYMVGTVKGVTYPEDGGFITGTFTPKA